MKNLFSIVIPVLNQKRYIRECLNSIFIQKYKNYEIIVVDGNSKDGTLKILKEFKNKFKNKMLIKVDRNLSQAEAINYGVKISKGNWVTWQNGDDKYFDKNSLLFFNKFINNNLNKKLYLGNMQIIDESSKPLRILKYITPNFDSLLYEGMTLSNQSLFWHKSLNLKLGKIINTRVNFDYEWFLRILKNYPNTGCHFDKIVGCYRIHKYQKTFKKSRVEIEQISNIKKKYGFKKKNYYFMIFYLKIKKFFYFVKNKEFKYIVHKFIN